MHDDFIRCSMHPFLLKLPFMKYNFSIVKTLGAFCLLGFIWGSGYAIARYAMTHGVPPLGYSFWQSLGPALFLLLLSMKQPNLKITCKTRFLPYFLICGLIGIAIPNNNMYFTAAHLPAGTLALLVNTVPLFAYPLACLLKQEYFSWERCSGVCIGFVGIMYLTLPTPPHSFSEFATLFQMTKWSWLTLISPICFALCSVYIARFRPSTVGIYASSIGMLIASVILLLPLVWSQDSFYSLLPPFYGPKYAVILEIVLSSVGYLLFFYLIQHAGPVYYTVVTGSTVGLTGLFWGYVLFGETLSPQKIIAVLLILSAILLVSYNQHQQEKRRKQCVERPS